MPNRQSNRRFHAGAHVALVAFFSTFVLCVTSGALAQTPSNAYTDGRAAQLNEQQITRLRDLHTPVMVPTYLPRGFTLQRVEATRESMPRERGIGGYSIDYTLRYTAPGGREIEVRSANEGLGDIPLTDMRTARNPFFSTPVSVGRVDVDADVGSNQRRIASSWAELNRRYARAFSRTNTHQNYMVEAEGVSFPEVRRIIASLRLLRP